jgi:signal transduction histidine kinase
VYYITLEALANVQRHANASHCSVRLELATANPAEYPTLYSLILDLEILDDGNGLNTSVPASVATAHPGGLGMISMTARAAEVGGECDIVTITGHGTRVHVRVPLMQTS